MILHPLALAENPLDVPPWVRATLEWIIDGDWPDGDETASWNLADRWYSLASTLTGPRDSAFEAATQIMAGYGGSGSTVTGFRDAWERLSGDPDAPLNALVQITHELGALVEECAADIEAAKLEVLIEITRFLIDLLGIAAIADLPCWPPPPTVGELAASSRAAVQGTMRRLAEELDRKSLGPARPETARPPAPIPEPAAEIPQPRKMSDLERLAAAFEPRAVSAQQDAAGRPLEAEPAPEPAMAAPEVPAIAERARAMPTLPAPRPRVSPEGVQYFRNVSNSRRVQEVIRRADALHEVGRVTDESRAKMRILRERADRLTREQAPEKTTQQLKMPTIDAPTMETATIVDRRQQADECRRQADVLETVVAELEDEAARIRSGPRIAQATSDPPAWARPENDDEEHSAEPETGRRYGRFGGLRIPDAVHQQRLAKALPRDADGNIARLADPRTGDWFGLVNAGGPLLDPTRALNCIDAVIAFGEIYVYGRPSVAAARTFDAYGEGDLDRLTGGEWDGVRRVQEMTGGEFQNLCPYVGAADPARAGQAVDAALLNLGNHLHNSGHGAFAFAITELEGGGCHAWAAVNQAGTILFLDPVLGRITPDVSPYRHRGTPAPGNVVSMDALVVTADGTPAPLPFHGPGQWAALTQPETETVAPKAAEPETPEFDVDDGERNALESLSPDDRELLAKAHARMVVAADRALVDLRNIVHSMPSVADDARPRLVGEDDRVERPEALAHAYAMTRLFDQISLDGFLNEPADRVRFSVEVPERGYGRTVLAILRALAATGYRVGRPTAYWKPDLTLNYGLAVTLIDGQGGPLEVRFPTARSWRADELTRPLRQRLRDGGRSSAARVALVLEILRINNECELPAHRPEDLDALTLNEVDTGLAEWIRRHPRDWTAGRQGGRADPPGSTVDEHYAAVRRGGTVTSIIAYQAHTSGPLRAKIWSVPHDAWISAPEAAAYLLYDTERLDRTAPVDRAAAEQIARISLHTLLP